jgi:hypothetical protein
MDSGKGGHVQDVADGGSSAGDRSMAAAGAGIAAEGRDDGKRKTGAGERGGHCGLETAGGFEHDQRHINRRQTLDETFQAFAAQEHGISTSRLRQRAVKLS